MPPPRVGVVGCGEWGWHIARVLSREYALGALCDHSKAALERIPAPRHLPKLVHPQHLFDMKPGVDAVCIATSAPDHFHLAWNAMQAGKDVFVEKPMTLNLDEARLLCDQAEATGRILMVGHILAYHPAVQAFLKELPTLGAIDEVILLRYSNRPRRPECPPLWNLAPHDLWLLSKMVEDPLDKITVQKETDTQVELDLYFPHTEVTLDIGQASDFAIQSCEVFAQWGTACFDDRADPKIWFTTCNHHNETSCSAACGGTYTPPYVMVEPLAQEMRHFLRCIETREEPITSGQRSLAVMELLDACHHACTDT